MNRTVNRIRESVRLDGPEIGGMGTWFPGPVGENAALLEELVTHIVREHCETRRSVYPTDPPWIDTTTDGHRLQSRELKTHLEVLLRRLSRYSIPWYSYRYHAHMNWDNSLPALVGYFAAMLHNQNNVAGEGSPVTTALEVEVADDLCRMLGFDVDGETKPWGHITSCGTVANIEAIWAARNVKLYPFAVRAAIERREVDYPEFKVVLPNGETKRLIDLEAWEILNLTVDETLSIPRSLQQQTSWTKEQLNPINEHSVQTLGMGEFIRRFESAFGGHGQMISQLACMAPVSCHYSMPKATSLLGLGDRGLIRVKIDSTARMDVGHLRNLLEKRAEANLPVAAVIAVVGTTQEGAVDPIRAILELREDVRREHNLDFVIHADAAWGGYFLSLLRKAHPSSPSFSRLEAVGNHVKAFSDGESTTPSGADIAYLQLKSLRTNTALGSAETDDQGQDGAEEESSFAPWASVIASGSEDASNTAIVHTPEMELSDHTDEQLRALKEVDSITVDPHKAGFAPYPAGALCYRNGVMPEMVAYSAPIVYREGDAQTVGIFGIEGSRPGAAAAGVWLSHRIIRPDQGGYGRVLGQSMFNAKRLISAIACMDSDEFVIELLQPLSDEERNDLSEMNELNNERLWQRMRRHPSWRVLFKSLGSDLVVNTYAVNLKLDDGSLNDDARIANTLNERVYRRLSLDHEGDDWPPILITGSSYDPDVIGPEFVESFRRRLGIQPSPLPMSYLLSTTANPWLTDDGPVRENMVPSIVGAMQREIEDVVREMKREIETQEQQGRWG